MELRQFLIYIGLITLFVVGLTGVGVQMSLDNGVQTSFTNNSVINNTRINLISETTQLQATSENQSTVQEETTPTVSSGDLIIDSTPQAAQKYKANTKNMMTQIFQMIGSIINSHPTILATFTSIILITFATLIWGFIRSGR